MHFAMENKNTETTYTCTKSQYINLKCQNVKNMRFVMKYMNTETNYKCTHFPYLNFKLNNAKKLAFCDREHVYGNSVQL